MRKYFAPLAAAFVLMPIAAQAQGVANDFNRTRNLDPVLANISEDDLAKSNTPFAKMTLCLGRAVARENKPGDVFFVFFNSSTNENIVFWGDVPDLRKQENTIMAAVSVSSLAPRFYVHGKRLTSSGQSFASSEGYEFDRAHTLNQPEQGNAAELWVHKLLDRAQQECLTPGV